MLPAIACPQSARLPQPSGEAFCSKGFLLCDNSQQCLWTFTQCLLRRRGRSQYEIDAPMKMIVVLAIPSLERGGGFWRSFPELA